MPRPPSEVAWGRISIDADRRDMTNLRGQPPRAAHLQELRGDRGGARRAWRPRRGRPADLAGKKVPVRRGGFSETIYARQTEKGGLPLTLASGSARGERPPASVDVREGKWMKPVGYTLAGAGIIALGVGIFQASTARA